MLNIFFKQENHFRTVEAQYMKKTTQHNASDSGKSMTATEVQVVTDIEPADLHSGDPQIVYQLCVKLLRDLCTPYSSKTVTYIKVWTKKRFSSICVNLSAPTAQSSHTHTLCENLTTALVNT